MRKALAGLIIAGVSLLGVTAPAAAEAHPVLRVTTVCPLYSFAPCHPLPVLHKRALHGGGKVRHLTWWPR